LLALEKCKNSINIVNSDDKCQIPMPITGISNGKCQRNERDEATTARRVQTATSLRSFLVLSVSKIVLLISMRSTGLGGKKK